MSAEPPLEGWRWHDGGDRIRVSRIGLARGRGLHHSLRWVSLPAVRGLAFRRGITSTRRTLTCPPGEGGGNLATPRRPSIP
jgi:hypothetical protein